MAVSQVGIRCTAEMRVRLSPARPHLVPEGATAGAAALLAALADIEEDVRLQQGRLKEGWIGRLPHRLPAGRALL